MDIFTPEKRSNVMSRIRSRDTQPELLLRSALFRRKLRYRLCVRSLPGNPDIVFVRKKFAIQVRGCFWHQHEGCREGRIPSSRRDYWEPKLAKTVVRDAANDAALLSEGWQLKVVWGCELKKAAMVEAVAGEIFHRLSEIVT